MQPCSHPHPKMEFDLDQRLPLASMHLAKLILDGGEFLDHLTFLMRSFNLAYPPEVHASLDDRLLKIQTDFRDVTKVIHKDIQLAMQQRLGIQQPGEEDEDEIMESASEPDSPPGLGRQELDAILCEKLPT